MKTIQSILWLSVLYALIYLGFWEGNQLALNASVFCLWFCGIFGCLFGWSDEVIKVTNKSRSERAAWLNKFLLYCDIAMTLFLAAMGRFVLATVWAVSSILMHRKIDDDLRDSRDGEVKGA